GHAGVIHDRQYLLQGVERRAFVRPTDRPVDGDATGGVGLPGLRKGEHLGALRRRQSAAARPDKKGKSALAFLNRDGVSRSVIRLDEEAAGGFTNRVASRDEGRDRG